MTVNDEQNVSTNRLAKAGAVGKFVILFLIVFVGLACILLYFDLNYILIAILAVLALVTSIILFTKQTYFKIYSLPALITCLLFSASCLFTAYGSYSGITSLYTRAGLKLVGMGFLMLGVGFSVITTSVAATSMNKLDFWKAKYAIDFKYSKYSLVLAFISGSFMIVVGLYIVIKVLQKLLLI